MKQKANQQIGQAAQGTKQKAEKQSKQGKGIREALWKNVKLICGTAAKKVSPHKSNPALQIEREAVWA